MHALHRHLGVVRIPHRHRRLLRRGVERPLVGGVRNADVREILRFRRGGSRYLLATTFTARTANEDTPLGDFFVSDEAAPDREIESNVRGESVRRAVAELPDPERSVVALRYGLTGDQQPHSVEQVVRTLGLSRVQVRQIEHDALELLADREELEALRDVA